MFAGSSLLGTFHVGKRIHQHLCQSSDPQGICENQQYTKNRQCFTVESKNRQRNNDRGLDKKGRRGLPRIEDEHVRVSRQINSIAG